MSDVIDAHGLTKAFGSFTAVDDVSFSCAKGAIFGLLGPNGSGKTTLIRMLCGILRPNAGHATVLGYDIVRQSEDIKQSIGYMSQKFSLYNDLTVRENIQFYGRAYGLTHAHLKTRLTEVVDIVGIGDFMDRRAAQLSGGWKQRLALGCALVHQPRLMFLDEPTAGIDPVARRDLWDLLFALAGQGVTFLVTTHYMDEAERCSHVGYIYFSKLIANGTPFELKHQPEIEPPNTERLEVRCGKLPEALARLRGAECVRDATIFGDSLHVLAEDRCSGELQHLIESTIGGEVHIQPVPASLEDVFVTLTRNLDRARV